MEKVGGTQVLRRGLDLVQLIGAHHSSGMALRDLVALSGLSRPTAYRLVACLVQEGFAEKDALTGRYRLGLQAMQLGLRVMERPPVVERYRRAMKSLARMTGDTVFLVMRQGDHGLCLHRELGDFPIKALVIDVGERRLLGIGTGGLAILAHQTGAEVAAAYARNDKRYRDAGLECAQLLADVQEVRQRGYAVLKDRISVGVAGVGCSLEIEPGSTAAISIATVSPRMSWQRAQELAAMIQAEIAAVGPIERKNAVEGQGPATA